MNVTTINLAENFICTCDKLWYLAGQHQYQTELAPSEGDLRGGGVEARVVSRVECPAPGQGRDRDQAARPGEVDEFHRGLFTGLGELSLKRKLSLYQLNRIIWTILTGAQRVLSLTPLKLEDQRPV